MGHFAKRVNFCLIIVMVIIAGLFGYLLGIKSHTISLFDHEHVIVPDETAPNVTVAPFVDVNKEQNLKMDVAVVETAYFVKIPQEKLGVNSDYQLAYSGVTNVSIDVDGKTYHLENAIQDGVISLDEITAYARMDAQMGYCKEKTLTNHSLTYFIYRYPKFDLRFVYDIYKTPDGKEHLIKQLYICDNAYNLETFYPDIDREDWGLTFEVVDSTSTSLTVNCTQSGGQQIGELKADRYWIYALDNEGNLVDIEHSDIIHTTNQWQSKPTLSRDTTTQFTIEWTDFFGELSKGNYALSLSIIDVFDKTAVHPLMEDFQGRLTYRIDFTIS